MTSFEKIFLTIEKLRDTSKRTEKESILNSLSQDDKELFSKIAYYTYNLYLNFYIRSFNIPETYDFNNYKTSIQDMFALLDSLSKREITGNLALESVEQYLKHADFYADDILRYILNRDLDCGMSITSLNKLFGDIIPIHTIMKAATINNAVALDNLQYPILVENKYDGCRCAAQYDIKNNKVKLVTSNGNLIEMKHLADNLIDFVEKNYYRLENHFNDNKIDFDGELVANRDRISTSSTITKFVRGTAKENDDLAFEYHIWDILPGGSVIGDFRNDSEKGKKLTITKITQKERLEFRNTLDFSRVEQIKKVESIIANDSNEIMEFYGSKIKEINGEGVIIKLLDGYYERGDKHRSGNWLKVKKRQEADLVVTGISRTPIKQTLIAQLEKQGKEIPEYMVGALIAESSDGQVSVMVGSGLTDSQRLDWLDESIIGQVIEIEFFDLIQDKEGNYSLYLPALSRVRNDKDVANSFAELKQISGK